MTKLVKNLIIGGSATTVLAGGGTGIALALSGKKSSNSNNAVVARTANVNTPLTQTQQEFIKTISGTPNQNFYTGFHKANIRDEVKKLDNNLLVSEQNKEVETQNFIKTISGTPETYTGFATSYSWKETKDLDRELVISERQNLETQNFIAAISGTPEAYTGFHRANIRNEIKKLDSNLLVSQHKAEIDGRTFIATQMQTPMPTTQEHLLVSPELELNRQANMEALVAAGKHELLMKQKADKKAEDKAIAEAMQEKAESDRVASLPEGTKDLKEGTKFDFVTSNIEYEIKKQAAIDAELAEAKARLANLVKKETIEARSLYALTVKVESDRLNDHNNATKQALIQDKVNEIQNQVNSQISTMFGNHPITLDHNTIDMLKGLNAGTQTFRYGTDLIPTFGTNGAATLNHILNSLEVDGVKFGLKTFIQNGKLNILAVAIDNAGHELKTSDHAPVKIDFKEPTRTISATSGQDIKYALGVAIKANPNGDLSDIIGNTLKDLATSKQLSLEVPNSLTDKEANEALIKAIQTYPADGKDVSTDLKNRYVYTVLYAVRMLTDKVNRHQITFANDHEREVFNNQILSIQKALTDAGY